jgi:predicted ATPase
MLRQLSVFSGSFDWPAVAAVVKLPGSLDEATLRATFNQLVDHNLVSLVSRVPERWRLLEMIREFARSELDARATLLAGQRHAHYYLNRLTKLAANSTRADYLAELSNEAGNCRAALGFALDVADVTLAQQLVAAMSGYWEYKGLLDEGRRYLDAVLDMADIEDAGLRSVILDPNDPIVTLFVPLLVTQYSGSSAIVPT